MSFCCGAPSIDDAGHFSSGCSYLKSTHFSQASAVFSASLQGIKLWSQWYTVVNTVFDPIELQFTDCLVTLLQMEAKSQGMASASQLVEAQRAHIAAQQVRLADHTSQLAHQSRYALRCF